MSRHLQQAYRFIIIGLLATLTHLVVAITLYQLLELSPFWSNASAYIIAAVVSYFGNYKWTFPTRAGHRAALPKFAVVFISGLLLNQGITIMIVDLLSLSYYWALLLVVTIVPVIIFIMNKYWVYKG